MSLSHSRQTKYFLRHLQHPLPTPYTSSDASRMMLAYFILAGLDLLGVLHDQTTEEERRNYCDWIYGCQKGNGEGFRGFNGSAVPKGEGGVEEMGEQDGYVYDPGNLPLTFFALMTLLILGDDLSRIKRRECLDWLWRLQREDGSFGETLGKGGAIEGGSDMRFCCCAAGIRYVLKGRCGDMGGRLHGELEGVRDMDVEGLLRFVRASQRYDGGFSIGLMCESHSGLTYCAIGTLSFLGKLPEQLDKTKALPNVDGISLEDCVRWMLQRQTTVLEEDEDNGEVVDGDSQDDPARPIANGVEGLAMDDEDLQYAGFNGRIEKIADTCYCFWNTGALAMLNRAHLVDVGGLRRYLLEKTQHIIGGFGKGVGATPDILHAYLGLAALSLYDEPELQKLDPAFCVSVRAREALRKVSWWVEEAESENMSAKHHSLDPQPYVTISGG